MSLVIDANVAVKWVVEEQYSNQALIILKNRDTSPIIAPDFLLLETANALRKKHVYMNYPKDDVNAGISIIDLAISSYIHSRGLYKQALTLSFELEHSIYDCVYLVCAIHSSTKLVTADRPFYNVVNESNYSNRILWIENTEQLIAS